MASADSDGTATGPRPLGGGFVLHPNPGSEGLQLHAPFRPPSWTARRAAAATAPAHPGTAILLDGSWYEVAEIHAGHAGRVRCDLRPWDGRFAIRHTFELTPESCRRLVEERRQHLRREKTAGLLRLLRPFVGLLPAEDQERLARAYGIEAATSTLVSAVFFLFSSTLLLMIGHAAARGLSFGALQPWAERAALWRPLFGYLMAESIVRLGSAGYGSVPVGSLPVWLPLATVRALFEALSPESRRRDREAWRRQTGADRYLAARDEVAPRTADGDELEVVSILPKDHWTLHQTGIRLEGRHFVAVSRETIESEDGPRHHFVLRRAPPEMVFRSAVDFHPEEVREIYRRDRRRLAAMWVESFPFLWGLLDGETQRRLAAIYRYDPQRWTRWALWATAAIGAVHSLEACRRATGPAGGLGTAALLVSGLYLLVECWLRRQSRTSGPIRASLLGWPFKPLVARWLRWESPPPDSTGEPTLGRRPPATPNPDQEDAR